MAEDVALRAQNNLVPLVRDYVMDIRAARAAKRSDKGQPADTTAYSRPEAALSSDAVMFRWSDCTVYKAADFARDDSSVEEAVERSLRACAPARAEYARKLAALAEPGDEIIAGTETRLRNDPRQARAKSSRKMDGRKNRSSALITFEGNCEHPHL